MRTRGMPSEYPRALLHTLVLSSCGTRSRSLSSDDSERPVGAGTNVRIPVRRPWQKLIEERTSLRLYPRLCEANRNAATRQRHEKTALSPGRLGPDAL